MLKNLIFSGLLSLLVVACASAPKIDTLRAPEVDFSGYSSFAFVDPLGTDRGGYASLISQQLKFSIRRELEILGFKYVDDAEQADLLVNAYTHLDERIRSRQVSEPYVGPSYWNYRSGFYSTWPGYSATRTELQKYTEGSLTIDPIDYTDKVMVWEGTARSTLTPWRLMPPKSKFLSAPLPVSTGERQGLKNLKIELFHKSSALFV